MERERDSERQAPTTRASSESSILTTSHLSNTDNIPNLSAYLTAASPSRLHRMKVAKACLECRTRKRKCTRHPKHAPCRECHQRSIHCSFVESTRQRRSSQHAPLIQPAINVTSTGFRRHQQGSAGGIGLDECGLDVETQLDLVHLYLVHIHDKPHTLFHPPSLLKQVKNQELPAKVLYGLLAIAARFSNHSTVQSKASNLLSLAAEGLKKDIDVIDIQGIQACVLLGNVYGAHGDIDRESLYFGIAIRMSQILGLPRSSSNEDIISGAEAKAGHDLPRQLHDLNEHELPMDEIFFEKDGSILTNDQCRRDLSALRPGLWGRMVQLALIFSQVQDLHRQHVNNDISDAMSEETTHRLASGLEHFIHQLPANVRLSEHNARWYAERGHGSTFVALHLGYHHYATLLYFQYLDMQMEHSPAVTDFATRCRHHAEAYSDLLAMAMRIPGCEAVYFIVAHMTVVSSAALLHTLFFGHHSELQQTRNRLKANFETLVQLRRYWPAVDHLMQRLFVFQQACMHTADPNTHRVDRWMVRFLLHHSLPVPAKGAEEQPASVRDEYADDAMAILRDVAGED